MRTDYITPELLGHLLAALTPQNELAMRVSLATGLRISDVLNLKTEQLVNGQRFTITEQKTGKRRRVYLPSSLYDELLRYSGRVYVFENRLDYRRPRTRQAVWKDLKRAASVFRVSDTLNVSCHSARKDYAVEAFRKYGSPAKVRELLNHDSEAVTALYILAESIAERKLGGTSEKRQYRKKSSKK